MTSTRRSNVEAKRYPRLYFPYQRLTGDSAVIQGLERPEERRGKIRPNGGKRTSSYKGSL